MFCKYLSQNTSFKLFLALQNLATLFWEHSAFLNSVLPYAQEHCVFIVKENNGETFIQGYLEPFPIEGDGCVFFAARTEWLTLVILLRAQFYVCISHEVNDALKQYRQSTA